MFTLDLRTDDDPRSWGERFGGREVQVWRDQDDAICALGYAGDGWCAMEWPRFASYRFGPALAGRVEVFHRSHAAADRLHDTYRRSVLPLQLQTMGFEALHASSVSVAGALVAFCGERRAGKSTLAYAMRRRALVQRSDDTLVLDVAPPSVTGIALPFTPRLRPESIEFFGEVPDGGASSGAPGGIREPLTATFILNIGASAAPAIDRLEPADAFRALLAHAHCFDPESAASRRRLVTHYLDISSRVPVFTIAYERRLESLDFVIDAILDCLDAAAPANAR